MNHRPVLLSLLLVAMLGGCAYSRAVPMGATTYEPRPSDHEIDVYLPRSVPSTVRREVRPARRLAELPDDAVKIGQVLTEGSTMADWDTVIAEAKKEARSIGGDALVLRQWGSPTESLARNDMYAKDIALMVYRYRPADDAPVRSTAAAE